MAIFKFEDFTFDSTNYRLTHRGQPIPLRPKASQLLHLLIEGRGRIVSKSEIFSSVWRSTYVRDHLLFQVISELRKAPLDHDFIRTQPNQGYQWNVATKVIKPKTFLPLQVAACLMLGMISLSAILMVKGTDDTPDKQIGLAANSAFSKGVIALEKGNSNQAADWFKFALNENPESVESSLLLAEALLQQNKPIESSEQLLALLERPNLDTYSQMTATDLLSRIHQRQGRLHDALRYARESVQINTVAQCSADMVEQRIDMLEEQLGSTVAGARARTQRIPSNTIADNTESKIHQDLCNELKSATDETSQCQPVEAEYFYVDAKQEHFLEIS